MNHDIYDDNYIRSILNGVKSIAMVGASPVNVRPSYFAFKYLAQRGYDMIPVNPGHVGKSLLGKPFVASLLEIGRPVDMIDIFRNSSHVMAVVDEALKMKPLPENRVRTAVFGNFLAGSEFAHAEFEARADADPGHAAFPGPHERRRWSNRCIRSRCERPERPFLMRMPAGPLRTMRSRIALLKSEVALTAGGAPISIIRRLQNRAKQEHV